MNGIEDPREGFTFRILISLSFLLLFYAFISFLALDRTVEFGMDQRLFQVVQVNPGGPADRAGFRIGDEILAQNGVPREDTIRFLRDHGKIRPGDEVEFTLRREGETFSLRVVTEALSRRDRLRYMASTVVGICFLLVGLVVFRHRGDRVGTVFYLVSVLFPLAIIEPPATGNIHFQMVIKLARDASILFLPPLFLQFVLLFPHEKRTPRWLFMLRPIPVRGRLSIRFPLLAISVVLFLVSALLTIRIYTTGTFNPVTLTLYQLFASVFLFCCFFAGVGAFIHSFAVTGDPEVRRRLRGVLIGTTAALLPTGVYNLLKQARPGLEFTWDPILILLTILLPISFGHAIVRYRLLDFELIIKKSILYTLLTTFLAMIYLVFVGFLSRGLRQVTGSSDIPATLLSLFLIALLFSPTRDWIQRWVDRTFYREKYEHRKTLHDLSNDLTSILDREILLKLLTERISAALHIPKVAVFLSKPGDEDLVLEAATGLGPFREGSIRFTAEQGLPGKLRKSGGIVTVGGGGAGVTTRDPIGGSERENLDRLDTALLLPLVSTDEMVGLISLGKKRSGEIYSHEDRQLLKTLANHASLAIENSILHHNTVEKKRMEQELKVAREIQIGFLPGEAPDLPEVEIGAVNHPCVEVGGDYYDFIETRPHGLGIAIGDATGDGVPAALLMANLQASFRVEAATNHSPSETLDKVNVIAYKQTQTTKFVTFFYGIIDLKSGLFRYANAGHNPPILVQPTGHWRYLDDSNLILGVDPTIVYNEHATYLSEGDLLVLYTDGVTDEINEEDESFGIDRLEQLIVPNRHLPPKELCELVLSKVIAFQGGDARDDITLLAIRMK